MRRGEFTEDETKLVKKVEAEYELFRYKMLSKSRRKIFDGCNEIRFYSCIYEYFLYADDIEKEHIKACLKCDSVIARLYGLYMEHGYLHCGCWENIEDILNVLVRDQEERRNAGG